VTSRGRLGLPSPLRLLRTLRYFGTECCDLTFFASLKFFCYRKAMTIEANCVEMLNGGGREGQNFSRLTLTHDRIRQVVTPQKLVLVKPLELR
jgi:hypothetical protein